jgi:hypothetical protein
MQRGKLREQTSGKRTIFTTEDTGEHRGLHCKIVDAGLSLRSQRAVLSDLGKSFDFRRKNYFGGIVSILSRMRKVSRITPPLMFRLFTLSLSTVSWMVWWKTLLYP